MVHQNLLTEVTFDSLLMVLPAFAHVSPRACLRRARVYRVLRPLLLRPAGGLRHQHTHRPCPADCR